jgi:glucosamine--fructose-6-phosphate aminotransferase (isomerizing)
LAATKKTAEIVLGNHSGELFMCGIVGAIAERNITNILVDGLKRLEYRGYDSAGVAVLVADGEIRSCKRVGKVANVESGLKESPIQGRLGVAHTRWATHGKPSEVNAHPHFSGDQRIAVVHNGIIENHQHLRSELQQKGYRFDSETDTETIVHLIDECWREGGDLLAAVRNAIYRLEGAYALAVMAVSEPDKLIVAREGSPLVIGVGYGENFVASDPLALRMITDKFIYLAEGDIAVVTLNAITVFDRDGCLQEREVEQIDELHDSAEKGDYSHFMLKEIHEQTQVFEQTLQGRIGKDYLVEECFGAAARDKLDIAKAVQIVACGTSYHAGMIARYWIEEIAGLPCQVEVASEFRYRTRKALPGTLFVTISQSGETADTLAALRSLDKSLHVGSLCICNVANSSLVRESDFSLMTLAGPEIGVASTKAFTSQLVALQLLVLALARRNQPDSAMEKSWIEALHQLPNLCNEVLQLDSVIRKTSKLFDERHSALFLGRGKEFPVAMEGALKLKEISYIHAEAYPAGELKHGPLALVDRHMPVVALAPDNHLLDKVKSNLEEVRARGGQLIVLCEQGQDMKEEDGISYIRMPKIPTSLTPILYTIPLQLLSYHVAVMRGTDVDQPRNLAKSVTVE